MTRLFTTLLLAAGIAASTTGSAPTPAQAPGPYPVGATTRDGRNDFRFEYGTWRTHYRLLRDRLVGSHQWDDCYGTSVIRPFWGGSGNLEDGDLKCPRKYYGGVTLRTYDAQTHQWSLWWGTRKVGIAPPAQIGHFDANGAGNFYAYDTWKGTPIVVRFNWTTVRGNPHFEQAFSTDNGKSWEVNWTTDYERVSPSTKGTWNVVESATDGHTGFDFLVGTWKLHSRRLSKYLANDHTWIDCYADSTVHPFWGGGGNLQEADLRCSDKAITSLTLRLYDATTQTWKIYWATEKGGLDPTPQIGRFGPGGSGDFLANDTYDGKPVIVRYRWGRKNGLPHFEQSYSGDNGKTWETNWISEYARG